MSVKSYIVSLCERNEVRDFIEEWHYSKSINGVKTTYCFKLLDGDKLIGAMLYGYLGMASVWKKYVGSEKDLIELRRLVCIDDTPRNTESYFIGHTLRWLRDNTEIKKVISYADPNWNHTGIIYRATNFVYLGQTSPSKMIVCGDKIWHDKTIRTYYNGKLKPYAQKVKNLLESGKAHYEEQEGKHIYLFTFRRKEDGKKEKR